MQEEVNIIRRGMVETASLKKHILNNFTWDIAAKKTLEAYKKIYKD